LGHLALEVTEKAPQCIQLSPVYARVPLDLICHIFYFVSEEFLLIIVNFVFYQQRVDGLHLPVFLVAPILINTRQGLLGDTCQ
jgi:hypothetical protein